MTQFRDFLNRFKPAVAPGSAGVAAVPRDRGAWLAAEVNPVLDMLADTRERCAAIVAEGEREAARITHGAAGQAAAITAEGMARAAQARDAAASEVITAARARAASIVGVAVEAASSRSAPEETDVITLIQLALGMVRSVDGR